MGYKYYDANGEFTNPVDYPDLKYYRGDGVYAMADMEHKFYDATGNWSAPTLALPIPDDLSTPENVLAASAAAKFNPEEVYAKLGNQMTPEISLGNHGSISFRLVGTLHDDLADGSGKAGLSFFADTCFTETEAMASTNTNVGGFELAADNMQKVLADAFSKMDKKWSALIKPVFKIYGTSLTETSIMTFEGLWLASLAEVGLVENAKTYSPVEGETYEYFSDIIDTVNPKRWMNSTGQAYWLRSGNYVVSSNPTKFRVIRPAGDSGSPDATNKRDVVVGFCV